MGIQDEEEPMLLVTFDIRQEGQDETEEQTREVKSETVKTSSQVVTTTTVEEQTYFSKNETEIATTTTNIFEQSNGYRLSNSKDEESF